jgi:hypothetical protein
MSETTRTTVESFRHYDADDITTLVGVQGWVPKQNVIPLLKEVPEAEVQYVSSDGHEAYVITE